MEKNNKPMDKSRLGRGLSSLIPPSAKAPVAARPEPAPAATPSPPPQPAAPAEMEAGVQQVALDKIIANTYQPRSEFDEAALQELTDSVLVHGILQPIMVRPRGGGRYELIAGERRFRAARLAGLYEIPAVVREMSDEDSLTVALIENIQREDLNAMEAARGYKQLLDQFGMTQAELARQIGKSQPTIANALSLLRLPRRCRKASRPARSARNMGRRFLRWRRASVGCRSGRRWFPWVSPWPSRAAVRRRWWSRTARVPARARRRLRAAAARCKRTLTARRQRTGFGVPWD